MATEVQPTSTISGVSIEERWRSCVTPALSQFLPLSFTRGDGSYLWDDRGQRYLDLAAGIGVHCLGHGHPAVMAAMQRQLGQLTHLCGHVGYYEAYVALIELLRRQFPAPLTTAKGIWVNSGSEATEAALKLARTVTHRSMILAFHGGFHGRPMGALAATGSNSGFRRGLSGLLNGTVHAPYPVEHPTAPGTLDVVDTMAYLQQLLTHVVPSDDLAAVFVEAVQGEGGIQVAPPGFLAELRAFCDETGALLIVDEVQTGLGRTGAMFGFQHDAVVPDVVTVGKAIGGGLPLGGVLARSELMDAWPRSAHGSTFGGNPVACAAGCVVLEELEANDLPRRAAALGAWALARFRRAHEDVPDIRDVRGRGLLIGVELARPVSSVLPALARAGIICTASGRGSVLRLCPALTIPEDDFQEGVETILQVLAQA